MQVMETTDSSEETSHQVIEALATVADSDPLSMTPTLYEVIDPEALDRLLDTDQQAEVRFEYDGHTVVASSDGTVAVDGRVFASDDRPSGKQR